MKSRQVRPQQPGEKHSSTLRNGCPRLVYAVLRMATPGTSVTDLLYGVLRHWLIPNGD